MFAFITLVLGIIWALVSLVLLFRVWDKIGPVVLSMSKSHAVQICAMVLVWFVIFWIPAKIYMWLFG